MADFLTERLAQEREDAINRQRETVQAYNRDALGSYETAQKRAQANALPGNAVLGKRLDYQFIQKVRGIAETEFKNQQRREIDELTQSYNLNKPADGPLGRFIDMPVRIVDALGRDLGAAAAKAREDFASETVKPLLGEGSLLDRGVNYASGALNKASALASDVANIVTQSPWIEKRLKSLKDKATDPVPLKKVNSLFDRINNLWTTRNRQTLGALGQILDEWWHDPRTLCCFIKTLAAVALAAGKKIQGKGDFSNNYNKLIKKYMSGNMNIAELTGTLDFFNKMIAILKIVRDFLNQDLNFNFNLNLDLGLSMSKASIGALMALLTALQQMLEDKIYAKMMEFVEKNVRQEIRQCLPFEKLLRLLADWMSGPDGIFKYIEKFVDSYMIGFQSGTQFGFEEGMKTKMMDVAALDKLIKLLEKMRDAMLNLELCLEANFNQTPQRGDDGTIANSERSVGIGYPYNDLQDAVAGNPNPNIVYPTDREIVAFLTNRLGESQAFADQVIASANTGFGLNSGVGAGSPDNAGGGDPTTSLRMAIGDCARTLNPSRVEELAKLVADWEII